jgi:hypothetical protein
VRLDRLLLGIKARNQPGGMHCCQSTVKWLADGLGTCTLHSQGIAGRGAGVLPSARVLCRFRGRPRRPAAAALRLSHVVKVCMCDLFVSP